MQEMLASSCPQFGDRIAALALAQFSETIDMVPVHCHE
jgi:hypothetical protein